MDCCTTPTDMNSSKAIDKFLKDERKKEVVKVLVLGAADSGKSTFVKQVLLRHFHHKSPEFVKLQRDTRKGILSDLVEGFKLLIRLALEMEPRVLDDKEINLSINRICNTRFQDIGPTELESMKHLFENHIFMEVFHLKCSEFSRAFHYLAHNLSQYMDLNYAVTDEDILRVRMKTTGIHYYNIPVSGKRSWCFIDVGGQKSER
eukprot:TRINITY_DN1488_c0_g1_i22.p1 TRINITY_DN1488_c0_g1~~TRINITY_DN1488_c0_g1_i22.p1  ORF type:complete len:204 (-),score=31.75 TRINITY_DN1488_c0_g1_i22:899-1510(-)